jgi:coproporphyrinogen III oxidase-like Fe-S oxidoreductase
VHWPFCLSKCPYCDFNSHVRHAAIDEGRFAAAFAREIETTANRIGGREVTSIFLGGGTPSLMQPQTVAAILDAVGKHWHVASDAEVTLEANPTSVEATRFAGYRTAGVRCSDACIRRARRSMRSRSRAARSRATRSI